MESRIKEFLQLLSSRGIEEFDVILNEMLRIKITERKLKQQGRLISATITTREEIFSSMKTLTEKEFGYFPGDRDLFFELYSLGDGLDLFSFTKYLLALEKPKNSKLLCPKHVTMHISQVLQFVQPKRALITNAEKHLLGLSDLVRANADTEFMLTTAQKSMYYLLTLVFAENQSVTIEQVAVTNDCDTDKQFDFIFTLPDFYKEEIIKGLAKQLTDEGQLQAIVPANVTFSGGRYLELRKHLVDNYQVDSIYKLPEHTFRPYTNVKTYMLNISKMRTSKAVLIGQLEANQTQDNDKMEDDRRLQITASRSITQGKFQQFADWKVELLLDAEAQAIERFVLQKKSKFKLKDIAEIFRGKSIKKEDIKPGEIKVINISNIDKHGQISDLDLDSIDEQERKVDRYRLTDGDILITCRGTVNKIAIFNKRNQKHYIYIPSANIIVIRLKEYIENQYVKIFLESPVGKKVIQSYQRGTIVMNINPSDIGEIEIPVVSHAKQLQIIKRYNEEHQYYLEEKKKLELRWNYKRAEIYESIIDTKLDMRRQ
ncbi:restriction endonuclease subunit S [Desulfuribacillus alkaliarsenatis]|uniref:Type I restriction modification DNA specificity domain-containing protein n=1 Tax=Desulfuribacillus alkaliarsenatis TaxID=766136 RepID=A0A1E5G4E1_9FIRM|nr:restriction endonuclease subunit S [Desulfuribacillus alkaliarsenatis]OEF97529.1 hypothetical protein BHF68_04805 [Desulfuribacillus alkaliarsenatis]